MLFNIFFNYWLVLFGMFQLASTATFRCYFTLTDFVDIPIESPEGLVNSTRPCLDISKSTWFIAIGYKFLLDGPLLSTIIPTELSLGDRNVVLVNWVKEAGDNGMGDAVGYPFYAVPNCKLVGIAVGNAVAKLVQQYNLNPDVRGLGHSLGSHLLGYAGTQSKAKGFIFTEIVAMDPARLKFEEPTTYKAVDKTCAKFVTVSHCDVGGYAINETLGHVDFWFNYGNYTSIFSSRVQPGCTKYNTLQEIFTNGCKCCHDYCWQFYNVALTQPSLFVGSQADSYYQFVSANGTSNDTNYYGPLVDYQKTGDFFLKTGATYAWGLGEDGTKP